MAIGFWGSYGKSRIKKEYIVVRIIFCKCRWRGAQKLGWLQKYNFLSADQGSKFSGPIRKLKVGGKVSAYLKGKGYVGFGEITSTAVLAKDFRLPNNAMLFDNELKQPNIKENKDDPELADWTVGVRWFNTLNRENALTKPGIFANQNIVCKLRHQPTIDFLDSHFAIK